ncbi:stage VI sporulation protein D [Bacillus sp. EB600]|uniref:stage VI sporulation protein D n=1 Tax=Bacillus sp. EB600 TaxID=2806345 RepID=UPI00210A901A|nr:stage VI sporulation protein D [Bacillus sp. EB600]MCQ6278279.1 stage VI sporulation protein D [Bacillus sp. EB600]
MSQDNQSSLRFSLEESLWFRKGQEVAELVSISLDPDITIQENDQYVTIRGSLELTGEYRNSAESNSSEDENQSAQKYVQTVEERDEGICDFSHRFPVDITIPNNRIQSIYDIDVMVESFDYTLPERSCLKLSAELTISGLYGTQQNESKEETQNFEVLNRVGEQQPVEDDEHSYDTENSSKDDQHLFVAEARKQAEEESIAEFSAYPNFPYQSSHEEFTEPVANHYTDRNEEAREVEITSEDHKHKMVEIVKTEVIMAEESSSSSSSSTSEALPKKTFKSKVIEKLTKKKSMSLTEFFARKEEVGDDQAKLKVCIVQKGDTLDRLAERYDVTMQNLLRVNQLELNQDVHEGQVLYIPIAMAKK